MSDVVRCVVSGTMRAGLCMALWAMPAHASHFHRGPTSSHTHKVKHAESDSHRGHHATAAGRPRAIDDTRATEIQTALVKAGYLQGASGKWDGASEDAMRKLQADNGWQTKIIPDSRALIKLGLGPGSEAGGGPADTTSPMAASTATHLEAPKGQQ